jgi:hypothetical protein
VNYFRILALVCGGVVVAAAPLFYLLRDTWPKLFPEKRPLHVLLAAAVMLPLCAFTWYKYAVLDVEYSLAMAIFVSLSALKPVVRTFAYPRARKNALAFFAKGPKALAALSAVVAAFGAGLICLGIYVY